ncbi:MAG TPA: MFS transporter [Crenalkalicoccus sp.]|jgi:predicted MFS family arabinose efflux permease|nr:MFS transporter [Crenalkalicoccus sp.]
MESTTTSHNADAQPGSDSGRLTTATAVICAIACGLSVANIYYAQPLLDAMARDFGIAPAAIGLVIGLTQIGYALGLIFIVPLGDLIEPRLLVVGQTALSAVALAIVGTARSESVLFPTMATMGLLAVVVQVLVAFTARLAPPARRGQAVGTVTSGVVIGILAARFVSGLLADLGGWRIVYLTSAALSATLALVLYRVLPRCAAVSNAEGYLATLRSIPVLFMRDSVLRVRGALALLIFAAFSTFWTALVLPLSAAPFRFSHTGTGLFGLAGVAGALAAGSAGRLADRGLGNWTTGIALALLLTAWGLIVLLPVSIPALIGGVILLDLAVQAVHVTNQSIIFSLYPHARSRLVGGYMAFYSAGSAVGAIASTTAFAHAGWPGVSGLGALFSATALIVWASTRHVRSSGSTL